MILAAGGTVNEGAPPPFVVCYGLGPTSAGLGAYEGGAGGLAVDPACFSDATGLGLSPLAMG